MEDFKIPNPVEHYEVLRANLIRKTLPQLREFFEEKTLPKEVLLEADNLIEFRLLLSFFDFSEEEIINIVAHENAHANKASSFENKGVKHLGYALRIKTETGDTCTFMPQAKIGWSNEFLLLEKNYKEIVRAVYSAPLEYGEKLSPDDIEIISGLN